MICIDDSHKPNDISSNNWVKKDQEYTVVGYGKSKITGQNYFILKEIKPDNPLYAGYNVSRFKLPETVKEIEEQEIMFV